MFRTTLVVATIALTGCSDPPIAGSVTNGLTQAPIEGLRVVARATGDTATLSCMAGEATTGEDGRFVFQGLCGGTAYDIVDASGQMWFGEFTGIPATGTTGDIDIVAWRAPEGNGVYRLTHNDLQPIRRTADVGTEVVGENKATYPKTIPGKINRISHGEFLVLTGSAVDTMQIQTLVESAVKEWWYVGVTFTSVDAFEPHSLSLDTTKSVDKRVGERQVRYIPAEALPNGRYAMMAEGDERMYLFDVGPPVTEATAANEG